MDGGKAATPDSSPIVLVLLLCGGWEGIDWTEEAGREEKHKLTHKKVLYVDLQIEIGGGFNLILFFPNCQRGLVSLLHLHLVLLYFSDWIRFDSDRVQTHHFRSL